MFFEGGVLVYDDHGKQIVTEREVLLMHYMELGMRPDCWVKNGENPFTAMREGLAVTTWAKMKAEAALSGFVDREQVLIDVVGKHEPLQPGADRAGYWRL